MPRNLERISKRELLLSKSKHIVIDMSVKGNHDCMSCGENVAYYRLEQEEQLGNWPKYQTITVSCECGRDQSDIIDVGYTQEELENTVKYIWNELNDFEMRMRELQYNN